MNHSLRHAFVLFASLAGAAALIGCGRPFVPATPPGFVDLGDRYGDDEYRATTAEGLVASSKALPKSSSSPVYQP